MSRKKNGFGPNQLQRRSVRAARRWPAAPQRDVPQVPRLLHRLGPVPGRDFRCGVSTKTRPSGHIQTLLNGDAHIHSLSNGHALRLCHHPGTAQHLRPNAHVLCLFSHLGLLLPRHQQLLLPLSPVRWFR